MSRKVSVSEGAYLGSHLHEAPSAFHRPCPGLSCQFLLSRSLARSLTHSLCLCLLSTSFLSLSRARALSLRIRLSPSSTLPGPSLSQMHHTTNKNVVVVLHKCTIQKAPRKKQVRREKKRVRTQAIQAVFL